MALVREAGHAPLEESEAPRQRGSLRPPLLATSSEASEARPQAEGPAVVGLLASGAQAAAAQLREALAAADGGDASPRRLVFRRELQLDVPADQVEEAVAAIVQLQPLPTSPVLPSSPRAGPREPEGPPPPQAAPAAASLERRPAAAAGAAEEVSRGERWGGMAAAEAEPRAEAEEGDDGNSYLSATSAGAELSHYASAASSEAALGAPLSRTDSSTSGASSPAGEPPAARGSLWQLPRLTAPPPPRPASDPAGGVPAHSQAVQQGEEQQGAGSEEEGVHAPPPTRASSAAVPPQPSPAGSPRAAPGATGAASLPKGLASPTSALPPAARSVPSSPATPPARLLNQQQAAGSPVAAPRQQALSPPSPARQGFRPAQRSRLAASAVGARGSAAPAEPSTASSAAPAALPAPEPAPASTAESQAVALQSAAAAVRFPTGDREEIPPPPPLTAQSSGSADEPQETIICGPWPPPLASLQPGAASPTHAPGRQESPGAMRSAFQQHAQQASAQGSSPGWHLADVGGEWQHPGGEVDWEGGARLSPAATAVASAASAAGADPSQALIHAPLVDAAAGSPPLSPTTTRLLALHRPSSELRRGPQRAATIEAQRAASLGLALPERQPSMLSPERQPSPRSALPSWPSSPVGAAAAGQPARTPRVPSWPGSPTSAAPQPSLSQWGAPASAPASPLGRGHNGGGGGRRQAQPWFAASQGERRLPVLNASPDVVGAPSGSLAAPPSPFPAHAPTHEAGSGSGYGGLGGLPSPSGLGVRDKREHRPASGDLSPREAYSEEGGLAPLLPSAERPAGGSESSSYDEEAGGPRGRRSGGGAWGSTALLASSMLGAGLVVMPRAFALMGLVAGGASLALVALLSLWAVHCLASAAGAVEDTRGSRPATWADVARGSLGAGGALLWDASLAVTCFGLLVATLVVLGDLLVGQGGSDGLLSGWCSDRPLALGVLCAVVLAPLLGTARGTSTLSVFAGAMWAAALLALTALAASQQATHRLRAWPDWRRLSGGGGGRGWLAGVVQLAAVAPVQLIACLCHPALRLRVGAARGRPPARATTAAGAALLYACALASLLAACGLALFGRGVQADVLADLSPEALASLAGERAGHTACLVIRLAFLVSLVAAAPLLMDPFRAALWRTLFWQPLLRGSGFYLVTFLLLAAALWASLHAPPLWQLLSLLGGTSAALTGLVLPGCLAAATGQRAGGALLAAIGAALVANFLLRLAVYGLPPV